MKNLKLLLSIAIVLILASCSDNGNDNSTIQPGNSASAYYPLAEGHTWIYYNTREDEDGNEIQDDEDFEAYWDTVRVVEANNFEGRDAFRVETTTSNGDQPFDQWYSVSDNAVYIYQDADNGLPSGGFDDILPDLSDIIESQWAKIFKMDNSRENIDEIELKDLPFFIATINGEVDIDLRGLGYGDYNYNGRNYDSRLMIGELQFDGNADAFGNSFPLSGSTIDESIYSNGIGLVESRVENDLPVIPFPGFETPENFISIRTLISHNF